jgi:hypothetical protein
MRRTKHDFDGMASFYRSTIKVNDVPMNPDFANYFRIAPSVQAQGQHLDTSLKRDHRAHHHFFSAGFAAVGGNSPFKRRYIAAVP